MEKVICSLFYRPILFFFLLPLFYLLFGVIFSLEYGDFQWLPLVLLYVFAISNQMLENMFMRIPTEEFQLSKKLVFALNLVNLALLTFFGSRYSWFAGLLLALYSLFIQTRFIYTYYHLNYLAAAVGVLFKVVLLNSLSFYTQARFVPVRHLPYYIGLLIPFYIYELSGFSGRPLKKWSPFLILAGYLIGAAALWPAASWWSLSLFLSLPFAWNYTREFSRMAGAVYAGIYGAIYLAVLVTHLP